MISDKNKKKDFARMCLDTDDDFSNGVYGYVDQ